jgi:FAD dependent oxidoreductase
VQHRGALGLTRVGSERWGVALRVRIQGMPMKKYDMKRIAVIGAGIFGSTIAIRLAKNGFDIDLFETENDVLQAASGINQYRLHRGYHYPRSKETALSSKQSYRLFCEEYAEAVTDKNNHFYCIAKERSRVSGKEFLEFCKSCDLEYEESDLPHVNREVIDVVIAGREFLIDPMKLRSIVKQRVDDNKVRLFLGRTFTAEDIGGYDLVINCAYSNLNFILEDYADAKRHYQFELCEKPILRLSDNFKGISLVILDGPFMCIDPYADTDLHVMGNVVHAIHTTNTGIFPAIPDDFKPLMNRGVVKHPRITNIEKFIETASHFMPDIKKAEHIGSMFTVRTVLPNVDHTDERPTLVYRVNDTIINVFSGKIGNCVQAALDVEVMIMEWRQNSRPITAAYLSVQ